MIDLEVQMRKGTKFIAVEIDAGNVTAYVMTKKHVVEKCPLSWKERDLFRSHYSDPDFLDQVRRAFNGDVLDGAFIITKDGKEVYPKKKKSD